MSNFNSEISKLYKDASGKGDYLGTLETTDYSKKNRASLAPGGAPEETSARSEDPNNEDESEQKNENIEVDISDTLGALFEGSNASPEFIENFKVIFESAINEKASLMEEAILEASQEIINEKVKEIAETLTEQMNDYLSYVVEEWMTENKLAVEGGFKTEIAENFIMGLKELFENSFIDVPEEKYDVLDELFTTNSNLEAKANNILAENIDLIHKRSESVTN